MRIKPLTVGISLALLGSISCTPTFAAGGGGSAVTDPAAMAGKHFDPKGKQPSQYTVEMQNAQRKSLPFEDQRDFEESKKGFIAAPSYRLIRNDQGDIVWNIGSYDYLSQGKDYNSIHPSLQRQAQLNMAYGLYEVVPGKIYQIRGFDLANMTLIKGDTGWILFDVLTAKETARAALDFANEQLGKRPVVAVVLSHSHADHFGGIRGVVDEADVKSGKVQVLAPEGFMEHAVSENMYAGNAMTRRMQLTYGTLLPRNPFGHVDQAIGKNVASGEVGLLEPTRTISKDIEEITIDGVQMVFQNTPGTEAPAEMNTYFPQFRAFWAAENVTGTVHNIYTLRGALVRDALLWSKNINNALYMFGDKTDVMFASHNWPRWGNERVKEVLQTQRDIYANLNNDVLHHANNGVTINEIHNVYKPPQSLQSNWAAHSYHGSEEHNSRAVLNRYLGYWDANPATLTPLSPRDSAPLYVEMMGGSKKIIAKGRELHKQGKYLEAVEILNKLTLAEPTNTAAKDLLADVYEQLGYQKESVALRNSFLASAYELRHGIPEGASPKTGSPDMVRAISTELMLDYLGVAMNSQKAAGMKFKINLLTPDNGEKYVLEMSNSTLTNIKGFTAPDADLTVTANRADLEMIMTGQATFESLAKAGKVKLSGNQAVLAQLMSTQEKFDPRFEILPGTKKR
ncbi:MBL fold metallo-hydrolase [Chitinibacter bivalviorum]|uniref:MBL fold metallo-hydrolase n=1 Tax=Chitinibacter bivalviorum TaxID=2739434 RepID=A0A7H9BHE2_9NEIS|nr:alkyl sulfatase dimerization domain-containing protein [Chitinibacter bivalviorum]QLG88035.1 MBL fold metallo-hydrolase [Chitinibacter bivalviorum]